MKEEYYTNSNLISRVHEIYSSLSSKLKIRNFEIDKKSTGLLVVDMQNYFLDSQSHAFIPSALPIMNQLNNLLNHFYINDLSVIFTKHIDSDNKDAMMNKWWKGSIKHNTYESKIIESLNSSKAEIIEKSTYNSFYNSDLESILKARNIKQLIVTGVMTHLCVETTIREAFVRDFEVLLPIDCTADYNIEFFKSSLHNLTHGFATPILSDEIIEKLELR